MDRRPETCKLWSRDLATLRLLGLTHVATVARRRWASDGCQSDGELLESSRLSDGREETASRLGDSRTPNAGKLAGSGKLGGFAKGECARPALHVDDDRTKSHGTGSRRSGISCPCTKTTRQRSLGFNLNACRRVPRPIPLSKRRRKAGSNGLGKTRFVAKVCSKEKTKLDSILSPHLALSCRSRARTKDSHPILHRNRRGQAVLPTFQEIRAWYGHMLGRREY